MSRSVEHTVGAVPERGSDRRDPAGDLTTATTVRPLLSSDEQEFITLATQSLDFHQPWIIAPKNSAEFQRYLRRLTAADARGFVVCENGSGAIVGFINLNQIILEPYFRGLLGYGAFAPHAGRGFMTAGLSSMVEYCFTELALHRLEADIQPTNVASVRLVQRLGFSRECLSEGFIRINGEWKDHERWVLINH